MVIWYLNTNPEFWNLYDLSGFYTVVFIDTNTDLYGKELYLHTVEEYLNIR